MNGHGLFHGITRCIDQYSKQDMDLEEICMMFLKTTLELSKGKYGYVACGTALEPDKMKYMAMVGMDMYLKSKDIKLYKPNRTFFTPTHLRGKWILIPLSFHEKLHGVIGFENSSDLTHDTFRLWIQPLVPNLAATIIDAYMTARVVTTQQDLFLSTMSHEIRTPLNGIVGMSRMLKESSPLTDEQKSYINVVSECTYQLLELINDILDFSKMDCDQLQLNYEPFEFRSCLEEMYDLVYLRIQEKKLNLWYQMQDTVPLYFMGDKKRIRQILLNLVNNAIKFTDHGNIDIRVYCEAKLFHVEVKDTGLGIPENQKEKIFKSFQQVRTQKPNADGVGLGLAICKKLCRLMGGDIEIQSSQLGIGTCMHFYLPLGDVPEQFKISKEKELSMEILKDKHALLIDTQTTRRIALLNAMVNLNMRPYVCTTQEEGLAYLKSVSIDIILLESKSAAFDTCSLPILYLNDVEGQNIELKLSHLLKPPPSSTLRKLSNTVQPPLPMDILIVEDNPYNMMVIHEMLKKLGYEERYIDKATTGAEAIQKAITKQYDVILMDLLLPTVDGLAAGTQILSYYRNRCPKQLKFTIEKYESLLPTIVALTAMVTADTQNKCKAAGFRGFLSKPLDKEELETMLAIVAKRRAQSRKNLSSGHVS